MNGTSLVTREVLNQMRQEAQSFSYNWFRKLYPSGQIKVRPLSMTKDSITLVAELTSAPGSSVISSGPIERSRTNDGDDFVAIAQWRSVDEVLVNAGFCFVMVDAGDHSVSAVSELAPTTPPAPAVEPVAVVPPAPAVEPVAAVPPAPAVEPAPTTPPASAVEPVAVVPPAPAVEPVAAVPPAPPVEPVAVVPPAPPVEPVAVVPPAPAVEPGSNVLPFPSGGATGPRWTSSMSVEQVKGLMTLEEAKEYMVSDGLFRGGKLGAYANNIGGLSWYAHSYKGTDCALVAAASILLAEAKNNIPA